MSSRTIYTDVEVEIDLDDFSDDELVDELRDRGFSVDEFNETTVKELIEQVYYLRRQGQQWQHLIDQLIYKALGRIA